MERREGQVLPCRGVEGRHSVSGTFPLFGMETVLIVLEVTYKLLVDIVY